MADRLFIDKQVNETTVTEIDNSRFLGLDKSTADRIELFLFAMAVGVNEGKRTPLKTKGGLILDKTVREEIMSLFVSLQVQEMIRCNEEEKIGERDEVYNVAQEYANTGFQVIAGWLEKTKLDDETVVWDLLEEMDAKYFQHFGEELRSEAPVDNAVIDDLNVQFKNNGVNGNNYLKASIAAEKVDPYGE